MKSNRFLLRAEKVNSNTFETTFASPRLIKFNLTCEWPIRDNFIRQWRSSAVWLQARDINLQFQINCHFINNSLPSIVLKAQENIQPSSVLLYSFGHPWVNSARPRFDIFPYITHSETVSDTTQWQ